MLDRIKHKEEQDLLPLLIQAIEEMEKKDEKENLKLMLKELEELLKDKTLVLSHD